MELRTRTVQICNGTRNGSPTGRRYSVFAPKPVITAKAIQQSDIRTAICHYTDPVADNGRHKFEFTDDWYAFIGRLIVSSGSQHVDLKHHELVQLGDARNNGSYVTAHCKGPFQIRDLKPPPKWSSSGTFTILCAEEAGSGHNIVVGLAKMINGTPQVLAAVDYKFNVEFKIEPNLKDGFRIRLQEKGKLGHIITDFSYSGPIIFRDNCEEVNVREEEDGNFTSYDTSGVIYTSGNGSAPPPQQMPRTAPAPNQQPPSSTPRPKDTGTRAAPPPTAKETGPEEEDDDDGEAEEESPYDSLSDFDTVFVIDDSGSMRGCSWRETRNVLQAITSICTKYDKDGIDIYFLNHRSAQLADPQKGRSAGGYLCVKSETEVFNIFKAVRPHGGTPIGKRLRNILQVYIKMLDYNKEHDIDSTRLNIIVITDGHPSDNVEREIAWAANKLDAPSLDAPDDQVGLQFFQVGKEVGADRSLIDMHERVKKMCKRDMIDTVTWDAVDGSHTLTPDGILRTVTGAFERRTQSGDRD